MTEIETLKAYSDDELIDALNSRGYKVFNENVVVTLQAEESVSCIELYQGLPERYIHETLGRLFAEELVRRSSLNIKTHTSKDCERKLFRAKLVYIDNETSRLPTNRNR